MHRLILLLLLGLTNIAGNDSLNTICGRSGSSCILAPQSTEGPYYWNTTLRRDITEDKRGIAMRLIVTVLDVTTCSPLTNAVVDVWHCDAEGLYSHYIAASLGQINGQTDSSTFLRGQQLTNSKGMATFDTIYPGWYRGRATHIHLKVHIGAILINIGGALHTKGGHVSYTGQLYFNDTLTDEVAKLSPYNSHLIRRTRNNEDGIYSRSRGSTTIVPIRYLSNIGVKGAIEGEITLGVNPKSETSPSTGRPRPPPLS